MCQPLPGPRCAGHLAEQIDTVKQQLAENEQAFVTGGHNAVPHPNVSSGTLALLHDEYDETRTGQRHLAQAIDAAPEGSPLRQTLVNRKQAAAARYATKTAALKATQDGNERRAKIILKHGADHGWLEHSVLKPLSANAHNNLIVEDGEAVGFSSTDSYTDYDYAGSPALITEYETAYETPLRPGPRPGTWITGTAESAAASDPMLFTESTVDNPTASLRQFDPATGQPYGEPLTMDDLDVSGKINDLTEHRDCDNYDETWGEPEIVRDADGRPVLLRYSGQVVTSDTEGAYHRRIA